MFLKSFKVYLALTFIWIFKQIYTYLQQQTTTTTHESQKMVKNL